MPIRWGILPVSNPAREGLQTGDADKKEVNFIPSAAIRSILGVAISVAPKQAKSPYPKSSAKMKMIFGRAGSLETSFSFPHEKRKKARRRAEDIFRITGISVCDPFGVF
jgi:hypothetical protein